LKNAVPVQYRDWLAVAIFQKKPSPESRNGPFKDRGERLAKSSEIELPRHLANNIPRRDTVKSACQ